MGLKLGKNGKHFAFIRFAGVDDVVNMERRLDGLLLRGKRLEINLYIHVRKKAPHTTSSRTYTVGIRKNPTL